MNVLLKYLSIDIPYFYHDMINTYIEAVLRMIVDKICQIYTYENSTS